MGGRVEQAGLSVAVVDDHEIVRESLAGLIVGIEGVRAVRTFACATEFLADPLQGWDAAVVDLVLPDVPGTMVLKQLATSRPAMVLVAITGHADARAVRRARDTGAVTCLSKASSTAELRVCLEAALRGAIVLDNATRVTLSNTTDGSISTPLSRREREVLDLLISGLTARQIGENLIISEATVRAHRHRIYQKLGVSSRREAAEVIEQAGNAGPSTRGARVEVADVARRSL